MSTCGVLPAVTLHCMGEQEATAVASVAGSWQYADLQRGTSSVPSVLRCVNAQSDSLVPSPSMASLAASAKGLLVNTDQITAAADLFNSTSASQQRMSQESLLQPRDPQPQSPDSQPQSRDSETQSQDLQLQSQGKSGWSSVVVLGSGLSVTAMAGAHMAAYGSPTYILDLLSSLGLSADIRVLEASAFSLWHVSNGADNQVSLLIFFLMTALCAAAAATLKLSPLPSAPRATISASESEQSGMVSANSTSLEEAACDLVGQEEESKVEATPSSSGGSRSSAWFSFSFSSRSASPAAASAPSPCTPSDHVVPEAVVARSDMEPSTSSSSPSSSSSSSGGGFFPSSISLPGYWFPFSASNSTSVTPSPSPAQSDSSTVSVAELKVSSDKSVTSLPALIAASPMPLAAPSAGLGLSSTRASAFLRLDSEDDLSDVSSDDEQEEEVEEVRELEPRAEGEVKAAGLPLSRSLPSSLCLTLPRSMSMNLSSSISMGLSSASSASSSAWSNVAQWSQSVMKSPVSLSLGESPAVLVRSLSQLFASASRSMAALPTVHSESCIDDMSNPAELRDRAMDGLDAADSRAVEVELREATALVGTRDLAALMLRLDWSYDDEQGPWEMIIDKHSSDVEYMTWRRDPQDGGVTEYRSRIRFIGATARDTCAFYTDCAYMPRWDPMLRSMAPLLACPATGVQSARFERKYPFCAPREYVLAWRVWQQGESVDAAGMQGGKGQTFFCITKAVEDVNVPRKNKPRRVDVYRSEWRMKDVVLPDGRIAAEMDMVVQEDSGMQRDMAKLAYRRGAWGYIRSTDSHLRSYIKEHSPSHGKAPARCAMLEQAASGSPPRVMPPLSVVKQVPSHLIPEGTPDAAFHAHCRHTATAAPSFAMAAAVAEAQKLHTAGIAALPGGEHKPAAGSSAIEGVTGQSQSSQEEQQQQQKQGRRFRSLAALRHLLMPAATVAAVGLGGGGLLCLNGGAVGTASKVLLVLTVHSLVLRPRASSAIELTSRQQL